MTYEHIRISKQELDRIYSDFASLDRRLGVEVKDSERIELARRSGGQVVVYASGLVEYGLFYISDLWVSERLRGRGEGSSILKALELEAAAKGCKEAYLWTAGEANARFYRKNGYTEFVRFEDCMGVSGHHRYGLRKRLRRFDNVVTEQA